MSAAPSPCPGVIQNGEHLLPVRVYYEDTDFTGVVYHAAYLRFFERGRSDCLRLQGVSHAELGARPEPIAFAVRRIEVEFLRSARVDDALIVRTRFDHRQGPRIFVRQGIERDGATLAAALVEVVCVRPDGRPAKPPADILAALRLEPGPATP